MDPQLTKSILGPPLHSSRRGGSESRRWSTVRASIRMWLAAFVVAATFLVGRTASALTIGGLPDVGVGPWHDVEKRGAGDYKLCWAAVAANLLSWGGWGGTGYQSDEDIYDVFIDSWTDQDGLAMVGINWWITGRVDDYGPGFATIDVPGYGGCRPDLKSSDYLLSSGGVDAGIAIVDYLSRGYGTGIGVFRADGASHALTVWGVDVEETSGAAIGIYFTDSDDGRLGLGYSEIHFDPARERWLLDDWLDGGWEIGIAVGLKPVPAPPPSRLARGSGGRGPDGRRRAPQSALR